MSKHVVPRWGDTSLCQVSHADVQSLVSGIGLAPAPCVTCITFSLLMELAVRDGRIPQNPATGVRLSGREATETFPNAEQVHALADAAAQYPIPGIGEQYRALILTLAFCRLRWGEVAALRVKRVDLLRRRLTVAESVRRCLADWCGVRRSRMLQGRCRSPARWYLS